MQENVAVIGEFLV